MTYHSQLFGIDPILQIVRHIHVLVHALVSQECSNIRAGPCTDGHIVLVRIQISRCRHMHTFFVAQLFDPKLKFAEHILNGVRIVHNLLMDVGFVDAADSESWKDCWLNIHMEFAFNLTGVGVEKNSREFWAGKSFMSKKHSFVACYRNGRDQSTNRIKHLPMISAIQFCVFLSG